MGHVAKQLTSFRALVLVAPLSLLSACGQGAGFASRLTGLVGTSSDKQSSKSDDTTEIEAQPITDEKPTDKSEGVPGYLWNADDLNVLPKPETGAIILSTESGKVLNDLGDPDQVVITAVEVQTAELMRSPVQSMVLAGKVVGRTHAESNGSFRLEVTSAANAALIITLGPDGVFDGVHLADAPQRKIQVVLASVSGHQTPMALSAADLPLTFARPTPEPVSGPFLVDDFTQVRYVAANDVFEFSYACDAQKVQCSAAVVRHWGTGTTTVAEDGLDPAHVLGGKRTARVYGHSIPAPGYVSVDSNLYLRVGDGRLSFSNDAEIVPDSDWVTLTYEVVVLRAETTELVLTLSSIDVGPLGFVVEVSDGIRTATLSKDSGDSITSQQTEVVFPLARMAGIDALAPTITSISLKIMSGTYGMDSGFVRFSGR